MYLSLFQRTPQSQDRRSVFFGGKDEQHFPQFIFIWCTERRDYVIDMNDLPF